MSVTWNAGNTEANKVAYQFEEASPQWREYCSLRESLIYAMLVVGFPPKSRWVITNSNWKQVFKRLYMFERATYSWRTKSDKKGNIDRVYFTPEEIKSMVGFEVNAGNKSDAEFNKTIIKALQSDAIKELDLATLGEMIGK